MAFGRKRRGRHSAAGTMASEGDSSQTEQSVKLVIPEEEFGSGVSDSVYQSLVFKEMGKLFQYERLSDIMLMAEGQSIPCHKFLLASASEYFYRKLVKEGESLNNNLLEVEDISFPTLKLIVSYLYTGCINITAENAKELIPACEILMLRSLLNTCEKYTQDQGLVNPVNCIGFYNMATRLHNTTGLKEIACNIMVSKFQEVVVGPEFKAMSEEEVIKYIQREELKLPNEDPVYNAVTTWVRHDLENRKSCFLKLVQHVRLRYCSTNHLHDIVSKDELMDNLECQKLLSSALMNPNLGFTSDGTVARSGYKDLSTLLLLGGIPDPDHGKKASNDYFMLEDGEWVLKEASPRPRDMFGFSACKVQGGILITGGNSDTNCCWLLSTATWEWTQLPNLNVVHNMHTSVCVDEKVYVIGGKFVIDKKRTFYSDSVECLDLHNVDDAGANSWKSLSNLPKPLSNAMSVVFQQYIYVLGGTTWGNTVSKDVFVRDSNSDKWNTVGEMPNTCVDTSAVVLQNKIYVVGGDNGMCLSFDPIFNQWTSLSACQQEHIAGSALVWKGQILICGGRKWSESCTNTKCSKVGCSRRSQVATSLIEEYDPEMNTWRPSQTKLPRNMCYHSVQLVNRA